MHQSKAEKMTRTKCKLITHIGRRKVSKGLLTDKTIIAEIMMAVGVSNALKALSTLFFCSSILFKTWISSKLDRVIVVGVTKRYLKNAIAKTKHQRDVVQIENLGLQG
jgi:hypothetical protein